MIGVLNGNQKRAMQVEEMEAFTQWEQVGIEKHFQNQKSTEGKKGAIVAILAGTKVEPILEQLLKIPKSLRDIVKEITLDMAHSMKMIAKKWIITKSCGVT